MSRNSSVKKFAWSWQPAYRRLVGIYHRPFCDI